MTNYSMTKTALAGSLLYKLLLRNAAGRSMENDREVSQKLLSTSGKGVELDKAIKPWRGGYDAKKDVLRFNPETNPGIIAREMATMSNPSIVKKLGITGAIAPLLGSAGAWLAPTEDMRRDFATYSTLATLPRFTNTVMSGIKGVGLLNAHGGSPLSKVLAAGRIPGAIVALASPAMAFHARQNLFKG